MHEDIKECVKKQHNLEEEEDYDVQISDAMKM